MGSCPIQKGNGVFPLWFMENESSFCGEREPFLPQKEIRGVAKKHQTKNGPTNQKKKKGEREEKKRKKTKRKQKRIKKKKKNKEERKKTHTD